jgi:tRNA:m4X modification enzyme
MEGAITTGNSRTNSNVTYDDSPLNFAPNSSDKNADSPETASSNKCCVSTILIALCCHHKCTWQSVVNREFLQSIGIEEQDFVLLTKLSSWAVDGQEEKVGEKKERARNLDLGGESDAKNGVEMKDVVNIQPKREKLRARNKREKLAASSSTDLSSTTTTTTTTHDASEYHSRQYITGLSQLQRAAIGRTCKRLIDLTRIRYLESLGYSVTMVEYVEEEHTLENVLLVATKPPC